MRPFVFEIRESHCWIVLYVLPFAALAVDDGNNKAQESVVTQQEGRGRKHRLTFLAYSTSMQSRNQVLAALTVVEPLPKDLDPDCPICTDEYTEPVCLSCNHIFCRECITQWFDSMAGRDTCPKCRRVLFTFCLADRGPIGAARLTLIASALTASGLTTDKFDYYYQGNLDLSIVAVQQAASEAYRYLAAETHDEIGSMYIDMKVLGPQMTAMANLLRGYAAAAGRPYSANQRRIWKIIGFKLIQVGVLTHGDSLRNLENLNSGMKAHLRQSFVDDKIDIGGTRFFDGNAAMDSASGDLDILIEYFLYQCSISYAKRQEELERNGGGPIAWATNGLRRLGQALFGAPSEATQ